MTAGAQRVCSDTTATAPDGGGSAIDAPPQNTCAHDLCTVGDKLEASCDPCVNEICATDSFCCMMRWSSQCVSEVSSICHESTCP
jgi:hypothetical protein